MGFVVSRRDNGPTIPIPYGKDHPAWKGGRSKSKGYVRIAKDDPNKIGVQGYIFEHIKIMEDHLGRKIDTKRESVHHKNGIRDDNRIENLELRYKSHPHGQTIDDLINYIIDHHSSRYIELLNEREHHE